MGLFGGDGRLVLVDDVDKWKAADVKELPPISLRPRPETVLALVADELKSDSALAKARREGRRRADLRRAEEEAARVGGGAVRALRRQGASPTRAVRSSRLSATTSRRCRTRSTSSRPGPGPTRSRRRMSRRWRPAGPRRRSSRSPTRGGARRRRDAPPTEELMDRSHRARSGELMRIISSMVGHVGRVRRCQRLAEEGVRPRDAAAAEDAPVRGREGVRSGGELLGRGARARGRPARRARRGVEGRLEAAGRSRARHARSSTSPARP